MAFRAAGGNATSSASVVRVNLSGSVLPGRVMRSTVPLSVGSLPASKVNRATLSSGQPRMKAWRLLPLVT